MNFIVRGSTFPTSFIDFKMAKLISNNSCGLSASTPYFVHNRLYENMFKDNDDSVSQANYENEISFLGATMRFPPALCRHKSLTQLPTSKYSENKRQPMSSSRSADGRRNTNLRDRNAIPSKSRQAVQKTTEELQIQQLYMEAQRHQAATARVTTLNDFQTMTFTLPAAKKCQALKPKNLNSDGSSALKQCPLLSLPGAPLKRKQRGRGSGPMFRGKKSWTSSAAAGSVVAEANQADQYYCKGAQQIVYKKKRGLAFNAPILNDIEEEEEEENKQRWKSLLPKKWTGHRSMAAEI